MTTLFWDCCSGISGNMAVGSLLDLGADKKRLKRELSAVPFEEGPIRLVFKTVMKYGIKASYFNTSDDDQGETANCEIDDHDTHPHEDHFHDKSAKLPGKSGHAKSLKHPHHDDSGMPVRGLKEIFRLLAAAKLPVRVTDTAKRIFQALAEAEAEVHGTVPEKVHFHEVGARDSIADIVGTAICLDDLGIDTVYVSPVNLGSGFVSCRHGKLPIPAPATANLLRGFKVFSTEDVIGELTTPTGAAILRGLGAVNYSGADHIYDKVGYGAGTKDFSIPNVLRARLSSAKKSGKATETIVILETNLDNVSGELMAHVIDLIMAAGALDAAVSPIQMKKGRQGLLLSVMTKPDNADDLEDLIFRELPTLGIRRRDSLRTVLLRESCDIATNYGNIRAKRIHEIDGSVRVVPEFEELKRLSSSRKIPLRVVKEKLNY